MAQPRSTSISREPAALLAALALSGAGAALLLIGVMDTAGDVAGLIAIVLGTVLAAPFAERPGASLHGWWNVLAAGALLALAGAPLALAVESAGGLLTVLGGVLVVVAVGLGFPAREG